MDENKKSNFKVIIEKLQNVMVKLNIKWIKVLTLLSYLLIWWGVNKFWNAGMQTIAEEKIFSGPFLLIVTIVIILTWVISLPARLFMQVLKQKIQNEIMYGNNRKNVVRMISKVAQVAGGIIFIVTFIIKIARGFMAFGANSFVLYYLTGCGFWLGFLTFFWGLEKLFMPADELLSEDEQA